MAPPHILQDRCSIAKLRYRNPELAQGLNRPQFGIKGGHETIQFCGMAHVEHDMSFVFLPRKAIVEDENENLVTAQLTMRTLARFGREIAARTGIAHGGDGETGLLAIIAELARDFIDHGVYSERIRFPSRNSGKPQWIKTVVRETAFIDADDNVVYPQIRTTRSQDSHENLLARVQASVLREIATHHAWWIEGLAARMDELRQFAAPSISRITWAQHLRLILPRLFASRAVRLATALIDYLERGSGRREGDVYFGVRDFHVVWEYMLRRVLKGVQPNWNSQLPRPGYHKRDGGIDVQSRGLRMDIVLKDSDNNLCVVDAKYYDADTVENAPGIPDLVKQFFYEIALKSVAKENVITGCFVFPCSTDNRGNYTSIRMHFRDNTLASHFPKIDCRYMSVSSVMRAFVEGRKIALHAKHEASG